MKYKDILAVIFSESIGCRLEDVLTLLDGKDDLFQGSVPLEAPLSDEKAIFLLDIWYRRKPEIFQSMLLMDPAAIEPRSLC